MLSSRRRPSPPLVSRDPEPALPRPLPPQLLLCREVALVEPPARGTEDEILAAGGEVEGEDLAVEVAVGAEEVGNEAVVGAEADGGRRDVAGEWVVGDLLHGEEEGVISGTDIGGRHLFVDAAGLLGGGRPVAVYVTRLHQRGKLVGERRSETLAIGRPIRSGEEI